MQLPVDGGCHLEADKVVLVVVGASNCYILSLHLGVEPNELARVALNGARVGGGDLGGVLVVDDAQFESVPCADASGVSGDGGGACVHFSMYGVECVFGVFMAVASGACFKLNRIRLLVK